MILLNLSSFFSNYSFAGERSLRSWGIRLLLLSRSLLCTANNSLMVCPGLAEVGNRGEIEPYSNLEGKKEESKKEGKKESGY